MTEHEISPERDKPLNRLLGLSLAYLEGTRFYPGAAYVPLHMPASWLINPNPEIVTYGLNPGWSRPNLYVVHPELSPATLQKLKAATEEAAVRCRKDRAVVAGMMGQMELNEYRPARLEHGHIVPTDGPLTYIMKVFLSTPAGSHHPHHYETAVYSESQGMIDYASSILMQTLEPEAAAAPDAVYRAARYLEFQIDG